MALNSETAKASVGTHFLHTVAPPPPTHTNTPLHVLRPRATGPLLVSSPALI